MHANERLLLRARQCHAKWLALPRGFFLYLHVCSAGALRGGAFWQHARRRDLGVLWVLRSRLLVSSGVHK